jgi:hypothetical protein
VDSGLRRRVRAGDIVTTAELKAEFRALAKLSHPDLAGPEAAAAFVRLRAEYDAALRDFVRRGRAASGTGGSDRGAFLAELVALLKRGFPKRPRHEKERLRYEAPRRRARAALASRDEALAASWDAFEAALLELEDEQNHDASSAAAAVLDIVLGVIEYEATGIAPLRAAVEIAFAAWRGSSRASPEIEAFLAFLVGDMGGGPVIG